MAEHELANEGDPAEPEAPKSESGLAAMAVALARGRGARAKEGRGPDPRMDAFLERQAALADAQRRLAELQMEHLHEERELHHRHLSLRYFGDRLRIGLQLLAILVGVVIVAAVGALAWQAHEDHGLVIDAFSVPPDLARDGLTGQVVAARFLDRLQSLQAATRSERPAATYQNDWGSEIKVEIPETGLTFGEFDRLLRDKLGHESHIGGEVIRTPAGIALTARLGDAPGKTFTGAEADLDGLAQEAAEAVYRVSQPYRYAQYLDQTGRDAEALAVTTDLARNGPPGEQAWADSHLAYLGLKRGDLAAARAAIADAFAAGGNGVDQARIADVTVALWAGRDGRVLDESRRGDRGWVRRRNPDQTEAFFEENRLVSTAYLAGQTGDYATSAEVYASLARLPGSNTLGAPFFLVQHAAALAFDHDPAAAAASLARAGVPDLPFYLEEAQNGWYALPAYQIAVARNDRPGALAAVRAVDTLVMSQKAAHPMLGLMQPVLIAPLEARALAHTGDLAAAMALIAATPLDCYLCVRVRGEIADLRGDRAAADRWFADAVRQAPKIPFAYLEWGLARQGRGDLAGAVALFRKAHDLEPNFADPLKAWGDVLAAQGRWSDAHARYEQALKLAPAWPELIRARNTAAAPSRNRE